MDQPCLNSLQVLPDSVHRIAPTSFALIALMMLLSAPADIHADELTLGAFVSQVRASNPALNAAKQRHAALRSGITPAGTLDDPFVAFGVDEIPFGSESVRLYRYQISQALPFPGKLRAREEAAAQRAMASAYDAETLDRELTVIATQQFFRAFYVSRALDLNQELQSLVNASLESAKARYETGGGEHHDWLLAKIELATLGVEQERLRRDQLWIRSGMNELRGRAPEEWVGAVVVTFPDEDSGLHDVNIDEQPELASIDAQEQQAASEYRLAKLGYYPDFVVQTMAMQPRSSMDGEQSNWGVMVGMSVPLYSSRKQSNQVAAARHEQHAVEMDKIYLRNRLNTERISATQALSSARDVVRLYERDVLPNTQMALANADSAYQARRLDLARYLAILKVHKTQQLELVAARIDVELAKTRMRELLSSPPLLKLTPPRPTLFGGEDMAGSMPASDGVSMGRGVTMGKAGSKSASAADQNSGSGMNGMK